MQYLVIILWVAYIVRAIRESWLHHCGQSTSSLWDRRWACVRCGMRPAEVRSILGKPAAIFARVGGAQWRYSSGGELGLVIFRDGRVAACKERQVA
jgi:hypothetical protein